MRPNVVISDYEQAKIQMAVMLDLRLQNSSRAIQSLCVGHKPTGQTFEPTTSLHETKVTKVYTVT